VALTKAERRQQLLQHARDVFARSGYHAAKIEDIVAAAGVARGTFYLYFDDKRAIFEEIVDRTLTRLGMAIQRVDVTRPVADQVRENVRRIVAMLLEDRATTKILLSSDQGIDPAFDRKMNAFYDELARYLEESLMDGQSHGIVAKGDARALAYLTLGALKELLFQVVVREWEHHEDAIVEEIFQFFRAGYLRVD
jgi:AcrR family transcriptional regulator